MTKLDTAIVYYHDRAVLCCQILPHQHVQTAVM